MFNCTLAYAKNRPEDEAARAAMVLVADVKSLN